MLLMIGTASFFKESIHLKTLGFHATEYGPGFSHSAILRNGP